MVTSSPRGSPTKSIIEVDLTAEDDDLGPEVSEVQPSKRINKRQTQLESSVADMGDVESFSLSKLFDKTLLAELISEDVWMEGLRCVIERKDRAGFEHMGPYTNPLWNQPSRVWFSRENNSNYKKALGVMLLEENVKSIKLCLSTIIRDMRWIKQKTVQKSPFEAHFGRLPKTEFKIIRDKFGEFSDNLDKQHLERSALTASQLKKRIDQSRDSLKIVKKGQKSRDVIPLFKQASMTTQERNRARTLRNLLEANANWNAERRRYDGPSLSQLVDTTSTIDPELRKELLYSWEKGFVEDKPKGSEWNSHNLSRRDETRKSGAALTKPFKGKVAFDSPKTVKTAAGAVYRKSDLVKLPSSPTKTPKEGTNQKEKAKSPLEEPKSKHQKKDDELLEDTISDEEDWNISREQAKDLFQDSETVVTSRDTPVGGGLNLAIKRAKPNLGGPKSMGPKTQKQVALNPVGESRDKRDQTLKNKGKEKRKLLQKQKKLLIQNNQMGIKLIVQAVRAPKVDTIGSA